MKKSILGIVIIAMVVIAMMVGNVNAANLAVNNAEVKKGDVVTVSVNTEEASQAVEFVLNYDATKFEYVADSAASTLGTPVVNANEAGVIRLVVTDPIKTTNAVTLQFKAIEDTEGAVFTANNFSTDKEEELTTTTATVKVVTETPVEPENPGDPETPAEPTTPETPATDNNEGTTTNNNTNADEKVGTNGQVITKLPQTGTPMFIGAAVVIALAGVALVVRKNRK